MDFEDPSIIYFWRGWIEDIGYGNHTTNLEYGRLNGKLKRPKPKLFAPHSGKQNRSGKEQAEFELLSKVNKKRDKEGYWDDLATAKKNPTFLPMLAKEWAKQKKNVEYPLYGQRKFDGLRCIAKIESDGSVSLTSRNLLKFSNLDHIRKAIAALKNVPDDFYFDGELYADPEHLSFQEANGLIRKQTLTQGDADRQKHFKYRIYDSYNENQNAPYSDRHKELENLLNTMPSPYLVLTENFPLYKEEDVDKMHSQFIQEGYEGIMLRIPNSPYRVDKRALQLLKKKHHIDTEYEIIDYKEGTGDDAGTVVWRCITDDGKPFWVRPKGSQKVRADWFDNGDKHIGSDLTVRYFELTDDGIPRFPVGVDIRDYE
jgi:DNA ligase-1|tara:strand:+ start:3047 stop:4159 length:1113 start_codon:yes stop_codon:yes gene_type:complete